MSVFGHKNVSFYHKLTNTFFTDKLIIETAEDYAPTFALEKILDTLEKPVFVIGVDIPFFSKEAIEKLILNYDSSLDGIITQSKEFLEPLCSIYSPSINSYIKEAIKENSHKLGKIIKQANCKIITFEDSNLFVNMNTPEDYQLALHQLEEKNV